MLKYMSISHGYCFSLEIWIVICIIRHIQNSFTQSVEKTFYKSGNGIASSLWKYVNKFEGFVFKYKVNKHTRIKSNINWMEC